MLVLTVVFGAVATAVSLALVWRIASTGLTKAALPAVITVLIFDLVPAGFVVLLHKTYQLVLTGRFSTGIVVAARIRSTTSWGLFYDFLDGSGQVVRGSSSRRFYTVALARCFYGAEMGSYFGVGSYVPVLHGADDSSKNALYVSFPWAI
jgi:riboflavin transporter FmnP